MAIWGASNNTIGGTTAAARNVISGNGADGVYIDTSQGQGTATGNVVEGNYIGTDASGDTALANTDFGVVILDASGNTIGGTTAGAGNVISGNGIDGVYIDTSQGTATGNLVAGNYIGTAANGTDRLANARDGVSIWGASNNTIGGTTAAARNVISGNGADGVYIDTSQGQGTATGNVVEGNYIGTDASGDTALANADYGVAIIDASGNTIGGTTAGAGNVISGNGHHSVGQAIGSGVYIDTSQGTATGNVVAGNYIGTAANGTDRLANALDGVAIWGASNNTIGGTTAAARNVISGNGADGVYIDTSQGQGTATGNVVEGNYIGTDISGTKAVANAFDGVAIFDASGSTIGGTTAATRNILSGNGSCGVFIGTSQQGTATGNVVEGNFIGTAANGTDGLANTDYGVAIINASNNTIGGTTAGAGNVISGNGIDGVYIDTSQGTATGNLVAGNYIGTAANGTDRLANARDGVSIWGASNNTIGGTTAAARNVISGNGADGVYIDTSQGQGTATGNVVAGNYIGTDVSGTNPLPNAFSGVAIFDASGSTIGGTTAATRNILSGNGIEGVFIGTSQQGTATGNVVAGNFIGTAANGTDGLANTDYGVAIFNASNNTIGGTTAGAGNVISGNGIDGVYIDTSQGTATGNVVAGNYIGTAANGTDRLANARDGVSIWGASYNTIGGTTAAARNVISGNGADGVYIDTSQGQGTATGNVVAGNYIGTDVSGTVALANADYGVVILDASGSTIGGTTAATRNILSGNGLCGVFIGTSQQGTATGNVVAGNYIGTDVSGTKALGNKLIGVAIIDASSNTIGGTTAGAGNVISGNGIDGVYIDTSQGTATGNLVAGNYIGTAANGTDRLANAVDGVAIWGASNNTIGGTTAAARNVISGNGADGVYIDTSQGQGTATGNVVAGNYIGTDASGTMALANTDYGVVILDASGSTIGGTTAATRNVISGNGSYGVFIGTSQQGTATGNVVAGNYYIGTDHTGTMALGKAYAGVTIVERISFSVDGVAIFDQWGNTIGTTAGAGNVIWEVYEGPRLIDAATTGVVVQYNFVGTEFTGTAALGNALFGVQILTLQLGGETGGMPTVPGLQPLSNAALPLIATLLTLTIQTSTAELNPARFEGEAAAAVSFLPESTVTVGQSLSQHAQEPGLPVTQESSSWQPFLMGLDEALDQFCRDSLDQFMSRDEPAPDKAQPPHALSKPLNLWQRDQASPEARNDRDGFEPLTPGEPRPDHRRSDLFALGG